MTPGRALDPEVREADPYSVAPTALVDAGGAAASAPGLGRRGRAEEQLDFCWRTALPRSACSSSEIGHLVLLFSLRFSSRLYIHNYYAHNQSFLHGLPCSVTPLLTVQLLS